MASLLPSLLFSLLFLPFFVLLAQNNGIVRVGDSLIAGDKDAFWLSTTRGFAFGFKPLNDDNFLLAIWYYNISEDNVVWYANGDDPAPRGSKVELTADSGLKVIKNYGYQNLKVLLS